MTGWLLLAVGVVAGGFGWLGLVWIPRQLAPIDAIRAFAVARRAQARGDGRREPLLVVGSVAGRAFTLTWQRGADGDVLLIGVDCAASQDRTPPVEGGESVVADAALVTRWVRPSAEVFARLDTILEEQAVLAAELERRAPEDDHEHA